MYSFRRRKLSTVKATLQQEAEDPEADLGLKKRRPVKAAAKQKVATRQPEPKAPRARKRKVPVVHEEAADIPAPTPAAVMADAAALQPVNQSLPAPIWTRETLSEAAEQLKVKDPGATDLS